MGEHTVQFINKKTKLDWESIRSSPRDGSSTSHGLTKGWLGFGGWVGVVSWVVGPQDFRVIPWHFDNGASSKIDDVLAEDGGLLHVLPHAVHLVVGLVAYRILVSAPVPF